MNTALSHLPKEIDANAAAEVVAGVLQECDGFDDVAFGRVTSAHLIPNAIEVHFQVDSPAESAWGGTLAPSSNFRKVVSPEGGDLHQKVMDWATRLGFDPMTVLEINIHANYVEVHTFLYFDGAKKLRRGGASGFLKAVVDIPINNP